VISLKSRREKGVQRRVHAPGARNPVWKKSSSSDTLKANGQSRTSPYETKPLMKRGAAGFSMIELADGGASSAS
jgi:hypothetical protein